MDQSVGIPRTGRSTVHRQPITLDIIAQVFYSGCMAGMEAEANLQRVLVAIPLADDE
jgi:hypothetical protein